MVEDEKLATDEARRNSQHESVKGTVRENVHAEISREASRSTPSEHAQTERIAESLKHRAVQEVATTESELERSKSVARVSQVVDYISVSYTHLTLPTIYSV